MAKRSSPNRPIQRVQHWWRAEVGAPVHGEVSDFARTILANESSFHSRNRARERIYEGRLLSQFRQAVAALEQSGIGVARLNATKTIIDTFVSRLSKDRPMPSFVVDDADWDLKHKAKQYRKFIVGQMRETEFDDLSRDALEDAAILGNGFTRIDDADDDVFAERILVNDLLFDERELKYGKPQQAILVRRMARDHLAELFPDFRDKIESAPAAVRRADDREQERSMIGDLDDYVDTFEAWHPPTCRDSENGRRVLCIDTATLVSERWYEPRFPFAHAKLFKPRSGLYATGFVDQLADLQHRVNCIVRDLQLNLAATGRGHFLVSEANDIPIEMLTGWQPFKLKYKGGQPPTFQAPQPFNPAQLSALQFFIQQMFDLTGVSQAAATSKSALGAGASGVALDTQYDIDSDRFRMPQANYARYRLDGAQRYLDAAARVARRRQERKGAKRSWVATSWKSRDAIEQLDYSKVELKEGQYKLQIEPVNFLPDTRAGKLSVVEQLAKAGVIPQWLVPTLFDEPDLVQANNIVLAAFRNCIRKMDDLVDETIPMPVPEPLNDLDLELTVSTAYYNRVQEERAPEGIQSRYRDYVALVENLLEQKQKRAPQAAAPAMAAAEAPLPGGVPMMPQGPVPAPMPIGAPPLQALPGGLA
ncbi:MAG: hypothetical protein ACTHU0_19175 [Kofleriaceae bacterium]